MKLHHTFAMIAVVGALTGVVSTAYGQQSAPYTGTVTVGDKAGEIEVALLGTRSLNIAAAKIFSSISPALDKETEDTTIYLYAAKQVPDFQAYLMFHTQRRVVKAALDKAIESAGNKSCDQFGGQLELKGFKSGIPFSKALSGFDEILGYFRVDHSYDGVPLTLEDSMLVHAVAGRLSELKWRLVLPAIYNPAIHPTSSLNATKNLGSLIVELTQKQLEAKLKSEQCKSAAVQAEAQDKSGYLLAAAALDAAVDLYDAYPLGTHDRDRWQNSAQRRAS